MKPESALLPLLLIGVLWAGGWSQSTPGLPDAAPVPPPFEVRAAPDPVDSARAELEIGRHWHAALILRAVQDSTSLDPEGLLLLARAEAGYLNWPAVRGLLEGASWFDEVGSGEGWRLLARALEEEEAWSDAARGWEEYLASPAGLAHPDRPAFRVRLARARAAEGSESAARVADSLAAAGSPLGSWLALDQVGRAAEEGDTIAVSALRDAMTLAEARRRSWAAPARAHLEAGDTAGAESAYRHAVDSLESGANRSRAWVAVGGLRLRAADTASAREAFLEALDASPRTASAVIAAGRLLEIGGLDARRALMAARALERGGEERLALQAYDLQADLLASSLPPETRLERARVLSLVAGRYDEAIEEFRALDAILDDPALAVRNLSLWMDLRRRQGRTGDVATLRDWILERHPESAEAVEMVFFRGDAAQDRGDLDQALGHYGRLQRMNSSLDRSGLARMRMAQIHLGLRRQDAALEVYRSYLEEYPEGRRWDEATYWIGRILLEAGDTVGAIATLDGIGARNPLSYYAVQASDLLGVPYRLELPGPLVPEALPEWLARELRSADLLDAAGLADGWAATLDALTARAMKSSDGVVLALALELLERGQPIEAINLGWALRERGAPWSRELLEVLYPFPFREMVARASLERGVDPLMVAALIRQESAFDADIVSVAGAVGLMQVMPATGRELASREGPEDFSVVSLEAPEVNLHLGTRFFRDMWERYDGRLALVLSAYNAGPGRANRWRDFPEASDPLRFTERIPFRETRDYVKQVTRNRALYQALYGDGPER